MFFRVTKLLFRPWFFQGFFYFFIPRGVVRIPFAYGHKKWLSIPDSQSFVNLKSNTMKNTLQRYGHLLEMQVLESNRRAL